MGCLGSKQSRFRGKIGSNAPLAEEKLQLAVGAPEAGEALPSEKRGRSDGAEQGRARISGSSGGSREEAHARSASSRGVSTSLSPGQPKVVMGRYRMSMADEDLMGEGTSSICWKATDIKTGEFVAIKVYKRNGRDATQEDVRLQKFRRQIAVLQELQEPFVKPSDPSLWNEQLENVKAHRLFMQLLDYSKDARGDPAPDSDGVLYVVTELAQYSLKDYLQLRREQSRPLPKESVRHITKAIVLVMAGLHAKGFVHIDLKPENLMMFNGRLKLIDVDGCCRAGSRLCIQDSTVSFSPCYCAPEWARFLIEDGETHLTVTPSLDVWSVGMTVGELVTLDAILKPTYANFLQNGRSHREAGFLFMDWLSGIKKAPIPKSVEKFDHGLLDLLLNWLLVTDQARRKTLAQSLSSPYITAAAKGGTAPSSSTRRSTSSSSVSGPMSGGASPSNQDAAFIGMDEGAAVARTERNAHDVPTRAQRKEACDHIAMHKGILWKLNQGGDFSKKECWLKRDMWLTKNGSLCYHSLKEDKRLILIDGNQLAGGEMSVVTGGAIELAIELKVWLDQDDRDQQTFVLGCESSGELEAWTRAFESARMLAMQTFQLGPSLLGELKAFRLAVKNRRLKVDMKAGDEYAPVFKSKLWKLKADTDKSSRDNWFEREMWISQNGSLVYYSVKEGRELIYYTPSDLASASIVELDGAGSCKRWGFHVVLPAKDGVEFTPSEFAAESKELRAQWIRAIRGL